MSEGKKKKIILIITTIIIINIIIIIVILIIIRVRGVCELRMVEQRFVLCAEGVLQCFL